MDGEVGRLLGLVKALHQLSILEADVRSGLLPLAEQRSIHLYSTLQKGEVEILVDRARMAQVLLNLLSNSLRHTPAGGTVEALGSPFGCVAHSYPPTAVWP